MEPVFCPRCETELTGEPRVCRACGFDESVDNAPPPPVDETPYSERYGTLADVAAVRRSSLRLTRTRVLVACALIAIIVLYMSLATISDMRARHGAWVNESTRYGTLA